MFSLVQISSNLVQRQVEWSYRLQQNLGQIDHILHSHVFADVICKQPIVLPYISLITKFEMDNVSASMALSV